MTKTESPNEPKNHHQEPQVTPTAKHWSSEAFERQVAQSPPNEPAELPASERAAFENAMESQWPRWTFEDDGTGGYHDQRTESAWQGWQARAALKGRAAMIRRLWRRLQCLIGAHGYTTDHSTQGTALRHWRCRHCQAKGDGWPEYEL